MDARADGCTGARVKVGIVDSGLDPTNVELMGRRAWYEDFQNPVAAEHDTDGHGTVIAQIIGGTAENALPGGVAPQASLYVANVLDSNGRDSFSVVPFQALFAQGVLVFNQSFGQDYDLPSRAGIGAAHSISAIYETVVLRHDGLFASATGDAGLSYPDLPAGLPIFDTRLQRNWLAVANVDVDGVALRQSGIHSHEMPGMWGQALGATGGLSQAGYASARYTQGGTLLGLDTPIIDNLSRGVVLGRTRTNAEMDGLAGGGTSTANTVGTYARNDFDGGAYMAGRATWSSDRADVTRWALIGDALQTLAGRANDDVLRVTLEAGQRFQVRQGSITPYASATALQIKQDSFSENGAGEFGLTAGSRHYNATLGMVGLRVQRRFEWVAGQSALDDYLAYRRALGNTNMEYPAALLGAPAAAFTTGGQSLPQSTGQAGTSLTTQVSNSWEWFNSVDAQAARGRSHDLSAGAGIRMRL